ncbi:MAG: glycoside hydrolase family 3 C-terminal domain-containing protein [Oscillospiraceae bacterium]|nr:glycoside hydrolase family 3 C-terminal domain-containing protein [Oscillospiraceae bacterium]
MAKEKSAAGGGKLPVVIVSVLLVIALIVNVVCIQMFAAINTFMAANLNSRLPGARGSVTAEQLTPEQAKEASLAMAQELAAEGIVLLENRDNALPLAGGAKVNLFGYATVSPLYGGTGSGASDTSANVDLVQGLTNAGLEVNQELVDFYKNSGVKRESQGGFTGSDFTPAEVPASKYGDSLLANAKSFSDTAVVMFSRIGGEGGDLPMDMEAAGYSQAGGNRSYLELTQDEEDLLELVKAQGFGKVIVLINSSHAMELGFLEDGVDAALWIGGPGSRGMDAVGQVLAGAVNPSGRLPDTYAYDHTTAPAYWNAGDFTYSNLDKRNYVEYVEGIYVGYRFYETRFIDNATGLCDEGAYDKTVQYPFGYGLSYTSFEQTIEDFSVDKGVVTMKAKVTNTGETAGKDVAQVYFTAPYTPGGIEKAHVVLAAFGKTGLLQPGESETLTLTFAVDDMASYDEKGAGCYVLEAGTYQIKLMANAHEVIDSREYVVDQTVTYGEGNPRSGDLTAAVNRFEDVSTGQITQYVSRADWEGTTPKAREDGKTASDTTVSALTASPVYDSDPNAPAITFASSGLTLEDMAGLDYDDPKWEKLLEQLSVEDMTKMISNGGWSTPEVASVGKPATNDLDGPAGINSLVSDLKGVAYPSEALIGASWNQELLESFGHTFGAEATANHVVGLYAPAVNIHRTPYSGRNFEYYSEDALLSGKLGAAMVRGYASQGVYAYVKHFALNDQESNRLSISVWSNEQAMRELYLKAFEVVVKEGKSTAMMSSYSYLGDTWAGASRALLTEVLRDEWGFQGTVVTDSAMGNTSWMDINLALRAGGDMMLCLMGVNLDSSTNTAQQEMRRACHNILYTQANSAAVAAAADTSPYWLVLLVVLDTAVIAAALFVFLGRTTLREKLNIAVKIGIVVVLAAVLALIFWACFFRSGGVAAADPNASQDVPTQSGEPTQTDAPAPSEPPAQTGDVFLQMDGAGIDGNDWLKCHAILRNDGTFTITVDYNAENCGIETDSGTWTENEDGSLALTGTRDFTATLADGAYTMEVLNDETSITCLLTGTPGGGAQPDGDVFAQLDGTGVGEENAWLAAHVTLRNDGTFTVTVDYNAENAGIETDSGTWTESEDGSLALTGTRDFTVTLADGVYTMEFVNAETSIPCAVTGTANAGPAQPDGAFAQLDGAGIDGNDWLKCHAILRKDGTFTITVDYNAENSGIETDSGTWTENEDGSLALTGTRDFTVTLTDGVYTMEVINAETGIECVLTSVSQ